MGFFGRERFVRVGREEQIFGKLSVCDLVMMGQGKEGTIVEVDSQECVVHMKHGGDRG